MTCLLAAIARVGGSGKAWFATAGAALVIAGASVAWRDVARRTSEDLRVTFLDVGQGDAAVIEGPKGFVALVDAGGEYDNSFDPGARIVEPFLRARGISRIDLVVLSHPHPDHMNGLLRILRRFDVGSLWTSGDDGDNPVYRALVSSAHGRMISTPVPARMNVGNLEIDPLGPWVGAKIGAPVGTSVNDASLVVAFRYAGRSILFTGDLEEDGEAELVAEAERNRDTISANVLKVPHHGSRTSSTSELLDATRPGMAVMSLGRNNRFGFPRPEVLRRYAERDIRVLRTDLDGAITVIVSRQGSVDATCVRRCR